jgi:hypothetical protein
VKTHYCQSTQFREATSSITGHTVLVNGSSNAFFVPETVDCQRLRQLAQVQTEQWLQRGVYIRMRQALCTFNTVEDSESLCQVIDQLVDTAAALEHASKQKARAVNWLIRLWAEGLIAWPAQWPFKKFTQLLAHAEAFGAHWSWLETVGEQAAYDRPHAIRCTGRLALTACGVREIGDLCPDTVNLAVVNYHQRKLKMSLRALRAVQERQYGERGARYTPKDWQRGNPAQPLLSTDNTLTWATARDATLEEWRGTAVHWLSEQQRGLEMKRQAIEGFLRYLIDNPGLARSPAVYCDRRYQPLPSFVEWIGTQAWGKAYQVRIINALADFLDWYLAAFQTATDDHGRPLRSAEHHNPMVRQQYGAGLRVQTHRAALPVRYIHELITIITDNDFAWPRTLTRDYFGPANKRLWSPVRAYAILLKLHLPLRTHQVRFLDSGEADSEQYVNAQWVENTGPLALKPNRGRPVQRGFLRKLKDPETRQTFTGFYISTNKTADLYRDGADYGYEIPWQYPPVIELAARLRDWQAAYNPVKRPTPWQAIHDLVLRRRYTEQALAARGENIFLFRDPCSDYPNEPVSEQRLRAFWLALLGELERRVAARGETLPDGGSIRFIKTHRDGWPLSGYYDLHSLRISLITAYATDGGVPIEMLSKCIAGHATILMTLYYTKISPAYVTAAMLDGQQRLAAQEQETYRRWLQDANYEQIKSVAAFNDPSAIAYLQDNHPGGWEIDECGICPVGRGLCHLGGPKLLSSRNTSDYAPVPGGPQNCVRCRFFITGPAWLGGLVAHFNTIGTKLHAKSRRYRKLLQQATALEDERDAALKNSQPFARWKELSEATQLADRVKAEVSVLADNWHATYALIQRCRAILAQQREASSTVNLVLAGTVEDVEVALRESSEFEALNAVCQAAVIYPGLDVSTENIRRSRLLDAMLGHNHHRQVFAHLEEDEVLAVGNEFVNFLLAHLGPKHTDAVMDLQLTLKAAGIDQAVERHLEAVTGERVALASLVHTARLAIVSKPDGKTEI